MTQKRAVKVIERLKELELTYEDLADAAGVSVRAVSYWLNYRRVPRTTWQQDAAICNLLKWTIQELNEAYGLKTPVPQEKAATK